jgi:hypothetical protein
VTGALFVRLLTLLLSTSTLAVLPVADHRRRALLQLATSILFCRNHCLRRLLHVLQPRRTNNGYGNERNGFPNWQ